MTTPPAAGPGRPDQPYGTQQTPPEQPDPSRPADPPPARSAGHDEWLADRNLVAEEMAEPVVDRALPGVSHGPHHLGWTDRRGQSRFLLIRAGVTLSFGVFGVLYWAARASLPGVIWLLPFAVGGAFLLWHDLRLWRAQRRLGVQPGDQPPPAPSEAPAAPRMASSMRTRPPHLGQVASPGSLNRVAAERGIALKEVRRALPRRIRPLLLRAGCWLGLGLLLVGGVLFVTAGFDLGANWEANPAVLSVWLGGWLALACAGLSSHRSMSALRALVLGIDPTERAMIATTPENSWRREVLRLYDAGWIRQYEGSPLIDTLRSLDEIEQATSRDDQANS